MMLYNTAKKVVQALVDHGYVAYFAGGWVRDFIMDHPSDDIDIATNAPVEKIAEIFPKTVPVGIQFGIIIVIEEGHQFEVATFRKESGYKDGRRPDHIEPTDPIEDAKRRDFTINGMFYDPLTDTIYDYVEGKKDIERKLIRAVGDPHERFLEDRLRMIRAIRYAGRFRFAMDVRTKEAILYHAKELFPAVAIERVFQEFKKMSAYPHFDHAIVLLHEFGLLPVVFPQLQDLSIEEITIRTKHIPKFPPDAPVIAFLYELFPKMNLAERLSLCDYLKLSSKDKEFTEELELWRKSAHFDTYEWVQLYARPNALLCKEILSLHTHDTLYKMRHEEIMHKEKEAIERARAGKTVVSSSDLIRLGIQPGPRLGQLLKEAERIAVNHNLKTAGEVISHMRII